MKPTTPRIGPTLEDNFAGGRATKQRSMSERLDSILGGAGIQTSAPKDEDITLGDG